MNSILLQNLTIEELQELVNKAVGEALKKRQDDQSINKTSNYLNRKETAKRLRVSLPTLHFYTSHLSFSV